MAMVPQSETKLSVTNAPRRRRSLEPPDDIYLHALRSELEDSYRNQDEQIDRLRELRAMSRPSPIPEELRLTDIEIRDPTIADEIQRVVATLVNQPPSLTVEPAQEGSDKAERNATEREHFTEEVLRIAGRRRPGPPTMSRLADAVCGDGGGVTKLVFLPDAWDERYSLRLAGYDDAAQAAADDEKEEEQDEDYDEEEAKEKEEANRPAGKQPKKGTKKAPGLSAKEYQTRSEEAKKASGPPFSWTSVDVRTVYPVYQGGTIGEVLEVSERPVSSTFRRYRLSYDLNGDIVPEALAESVPVSPGVQPGAGDLTESHPTSCLFIEHWDDVYCTHYVAGSNKQGKGTGQVVEQWKHGYGRHPYFFTLGFMPAYWANRKVGWGISESKRWLVEFRSYLWTIFAQQVARDTLPPVTVTVPEGGQPIRGRDGTPMTHERYRLGQMYYGQPGEKREPWVFPDTSQSLKEMIGLITEMIDKLSTPRMEGNLGGVEASGFAINQVLAESRLRFDPLAQAMERTLDEVTRFLWHLIRTKIGETVWVYATGDKSGWLGMGPKDLKGDVRIEWKLDPTLPSAALVESRYWVEQVKAGFASMDQAITAQGRNPDEVRFGQTLDRMRQSEWYTKFMDQYVTSAVGRGDLTSQAWEAQQLAQTGQMPMAPGGAPPPGGVVPAEGMNANAVASNGVPPAGMNTPGLPDMGNAAMAPNQEGAVGVGPGAVYGTPTVPSTSAAAGVVQPLQS